MHNRIVVIWYEVTSGLVLVAVAMYLVPRYLKQGITTVPDFLEDRYDSGVKKIISILFFYYKSSLNPC